VLAARRRCDGRRRLDPHIHACRRCIGAEIELNGRYELSGRLARRDIHLDEAW